MVQINFTLIIAMGLFLLFLWVTKRFIFRPILDVMDAREAKLLEDRETMESRTAEARSLETAYSDAKTQAKQSAALRIRKTRNDAWEKSREALHQLRVGKDAEVTAFREALTARHDEERRQYPELLPKLTETMDRWVRSEEAGR